MTEKNIPTPEELRKLLRYEPETGKLFWVPRPEESFASVNAARSWNTKYAGKEAFTSLDRDGYRQGTICGIFVRAHRVIWAIMTGEWPSDTIDHKNTQKTDNTFINLRSASMSQQKMNCGASASNTSGIKGVYWSNTYRKWIAKIRAEGKIYHLGYYDIKSEAAAAYASAAYKLHGEFARTE